MTLWSSSIEREQRKQAKKEKKAEKEERKRQEKQEKVERRSKGKRATDAELRTESQEDKPWFSRAQIPPSGGAGICNGCRYEINKLFVQHRSKEDVKNRRVKFHDSFQELQDCSKTCRACRMFENALLRCQASKEHEDALLIGGHTTKVVQARLDPDDGSNALRIEITVGDPSDDQDAQIVQLSCERREVDLLKLEDKYDDPTIKDQAASWLNECLENHNDCRLLSWSGKNPTRLIKILDGGTVQLVELGNEKRVDYVALSYCWGGILPDDEFAMLQSGETWTTKLEKRRQSFSISEFPKTTRDAVRFVYSLGQQYIWIDAVCILQDTGGPGSDKEKEMVRMHEYYGNALFTLCVSSAVKCTEGFLRRRQAWRWAEIECKLGGYNIANFDISLDEARDRSPLSARGWTLQEEYLSPRILYWFSNSMYWSCAKAKHIEGVEDPSRRPIQSSRKLKRVSEQRLEHNFLMACRNDWGDIQHSEWLRVVESYTKREIKYTTDRCDAISGVAARYYSTRYRHNDQYLAGLWKNTFASELIWRTVTGADRNEQRDTLPDYPSWSWMSLPLQTAIWIHPDEFDKSFKLAPAFQLEPASLPVRDPTWAPGEAVKKGGDGVKAVQVTGRLRAFWTDSSIQASWEENTTRAKDGTLLFLPQGSILDDMYTVDVNTGRIIVAGERMEEIFGYLDYVQDAERVASGLLRLFSLEVGRSSMLLLEMTQDQTYRRVGVSHRFWESFFVNSRVETITLK